MRARPESTKSNTAQPRRKGPYLPTRRKTKKLLVALTLNSLKYIDAAPALRFRGPFCPRNMKLSPRTMGLSNHGRPFGKRRCSPRQGAFWETRSAPAFLLLFLGLNGMVHRRQVSFHLRKSLLPRSGFLLLAVPLTHVAVIQPGALAVLSRIAPLLRNLGWQGARRSCASRR